jgi:hypothetical protein
MIFSGRLILIQALAATWSSVCPTAAMASTARRRQRPPDVSGVLVQERTILLRPPNAGSRHKMEDPLGSGFFLFFSLSPSSPSAPLLCIHRLSSSSTSIRPNLVPCHTPILGMVEEGLFLGAAVLVYLYLACHHVALLREVAEAH